MPKHTAAERKKKKTNIVTPLVPPLAPTPVIPEQQTDPNFRLPPGTPRTTTPTPPTPPKPTPPPAGVTPLPAADELKLQQRQLTGEDLLALFPPETFGGVARSAALKAVGSKETQEVIKRRAARGAFLDQKIVAEVAAEFARAGAKYTPEELNALALELEKIRPAEGFTIQRLDYEQAFKSALLTGIASAATFGGIAAAAGASVAGPPGAVALGVPTAVISFIGGGLAQFTLSLKRQRADINKGKSIILLENKQTLLRLILARDKGQDAVVVSEMFDAQMELINTAHEVLKLTVKDDSKNWLGEDGEIPITKFETFYSKGGVRDFLNLEFQRALLNPDPTRTLIDLQAGIAAIEAGQ